MRFRRELFGAWGLALVVAALLGCETPPADRQGEKELPSLRTINSGSPPELLAVEGERLTDAAKAEARITEVYLPLDASLEPAWAVVDEDVFPAVTRGVWRSNGLRVGLLHQTQLSSFLDELPGTLGEKDLTYIGYDQRSPMRHSPRLAATLYADLTVPPFAPRREFVKGHRLQLLASLSPRAGGTRVELTPHHHVPRLTLKPRSPLEKLLDGRIFEELSVWVDVPRDRFLVLGLYRDPTHLAPPAEEQPTAPIDAPENGASEPETPPAPLSGVQVRSVPPSLRGQAIVLWSADRFAQAERAAPRAAGERFGDAIDHRPPPPVPMHLGRGLFTQPWRGRDVQVLMLVKFTPVR